MTRPIPHKLLTLLAVLALAGGLGAAALVLSTSRGKTLVFLALWSARYTAVERPESEIEVFSRRINVAIVAEQLTQSPTRYDPAYVEIAYPGGDVPPDTGVCTDLVVRAFRSVDIDLQRDVHEDMAADFAAYPDLWGAGKADSNIDHRRVPNLMVFFRRHGTVLPITDVASDYEPGDIVAWHLGKGLTHIGIVSTRADPASGRFLVAHHVGGKPSLDDALFRWRIVGHFQYGGLKGLPAPRSGPAR